MHYNINVMIKKKEEKWEIQNVTFALNPWKLKKKVIAKSVKTGWEI